jgi:hypothetical protein
LKTPLWAVVLALPVAADFVLSTFKVRDRLVVEGDSLVGKRRRNDKVYFEQRVELAHVTGVHDTSDHIRIDLDDGTSWHVGEGLNVPRNVRRWVATRVARLLPPAAEVAAAPMIGAGEGESASEPSGK